MNCKPYEWSTTILSDMLSIPNWNSIADQLALSLFCMTQRMTVIRHWFSDFTGLFWPTIWNTRTSKVGNEQTRQLLTSTPYLLLSKTIQTKKTSSSGFQPTSKWLELTFLAIGFLITSFQMCNSRCKGITKLPFWHCTGFGYLGVSTLDFWLFTCMNIFVPLQISKPKIWRAHELYIA